MDDLQQFKNWSALAFRALDDANKVLETIEPESWFEQEKIAELRDRIQEVAIQALVLHGVMSRNQLDAVLSPQGENHG